MTTSQSRNYWITVSVFALVSVALRVRFVWSPLSIDEGGYLAIARAWGTKDLYTDVWIDRPQGLISLFVGLDLITPGSTQSVRVMAILFGVVAVFACASIARSLAGTTAGVLAALFVAVTSASPAIEGFTANGELLSATFSAVSVALGCLVLTDRVRMRAMITAGVFAGLAMSVRQSAFDGYLALATWLVVAAAAGWRPRRWALHAVGLLTGGLFVVIGLLAIHGAVTGWDDWYYAVLGFRLDGRSAATGSNWTRLATTFQDVRHVFVPLVVACVVVVIAALIKRRGLAIRSLRPEYLVVGLWTLFSLVGFASGGQFFHHYFMILTFPVSVGAALVLSTIDRTWLRRSVAVAVTVPALWTATSLITLPRSDIPEAIDGTKRPIKEERVGTWFRDNLQPGDSIYALCAGASTYAQARSDPPYPYLWFWAVKLVPGAGERLYDLLSSDDAPTFVAVFQRPEACMLEGDRADVLAENYRPFVTVDGVQIMIRESDPRR